MKYQISSTTLPNNVSIALDGSKSISNRLLILQQVSKHNFSLENLSKSDDSVLMQEVLSKYQTENKLNVQNAGTVTRFITAFLSTQNGTWELDCAPPMKKRPIKLLVDVLRELGAEIKYLEQEGYLPLQITGQKLVSKPISIDAGISSQYISALMMIAPLLPKGLTIHLEGEVASRPYLEITVRAMEQAGFTVSFVGNTIEVAAGQKPLESDSIFVESDWSAAAFYYTIASLNQFESISLSSLQPPHKSTQGDSIAAEFYGKLGIETTYENKTATLKTQTSEAYGNEELTFDFFDQPDMVPAFAVACGILGVKATFSGVKNLVIKESNRLVAMQNELKKLGVEFTAINHDLWKIEGKIDTDKFSQTIIETYHDHRIAMAFGTLAFLADGLTIDSPYVVTKSYPDFWEDMKKLGMEIEELD